MPRKSDMSPEAWQRHVAASAAWKRANADKVRASALRYNADPQKKLANKKYRDHRLAEDPDGWREYERLANKKKYDRRKAEDPAGFTARNRERQQLRYESDPEKERARSRVRYRATNPLPEKTGRDLFLVLLHGIPKSIPAHIRDDVIGEMALGLSDGSIKPRSIGSEIRRFITAQYRHQDYHRVLSLDSPLPGKEGQTWVDALESDVEHF